MSWLDRAEPVSSAGTGTEQKPRPKWLERAEEVSSTSTPSEPPAQTVQPDSSTPPQEVQALELLGDEDFKRIGQKYGVDPEELRNLAPYYGAKAAPRSFGEAISQGAKGTAGFIGSGPLFGVPQFIAKKLQDEPTRLALDEITEIAGKQASIPEKLAEGIAGPAGSASMFPALTKNVATRIGTATGVGAVAGLSQSKEGEELRGAGTGALLGGGLGTTLEGVGFALNKMIRPNVSETKLIENQAASRQFDMQEGGREVSKRTANSDPILEGTTLSVKEQMTPQEVDILTREQLGDAALSKYLDPTTSEGKLIRREIDGPINEQTIRAKLADDLIEQRAIDFAEVLTKERPKTGEKALEAIQDYSSRQGPEATQNLYREFQESQAVNKYIAENGIKAVDDPNFFGKTLNFLSDNQFVMRHIDNKYGTKLEKILRELNKAYNRSTFALRDFRTRYDNVFKIATSNGTDNTVTSTDRIYNALDTGDISALSREEVQTAEGFKKYFQDILGYVNGVVKEKDPRIAPLSIPPRENYVPKMLKATPELITIMEKKIQETTQELSKILKRDINDLAQVSSKELSTLADNPNVQDLIKAVNLFDSKKIESGADLSSRLKEMLYKRDGNIALETAARAAMERKGLIPDFMLEKNLYKLARRYTDNTMRHLYLRNGIDKLRFQAESLKKAGAEADAGYIENLIRDINGVRRGTAAEAMLQTRIKMSRTLDTLIDKAGANSPTGQALTLVKSFPDFLSYISRQIYPNILGYWNVRAAIQNATSGVTKIAPELGTNYGYTTTVRGAVHTLGNIKRLLEKSKQVGSMPAEYVRSGERAIAEGIARNAGVQFTRDALEKLGQAGMVLFQGVENLNRALVYGVGETMARDIARGSNLALGSLSKFPASVRKEVLLNRNNEQAVADILGNYLNDVTQYNYNRISLSEFGRTMGPFFSTFSKWPTATVGDIIQEMREKGAIKSIPRNIEKYIAPLLLLQSVDYILGERAGDPESLSPEQKKLIGSYGMSQSAPVGAAGAILKGEIFTPPAVDAVVQTFIVPVIEGDTGKLERGAASMANSFLPGAGLLRFITDDAVTYATGDRPQGSNFIERTASGAQRISK